MLEVQQTDNLALPILADTVWQEAQHRLGMIVRRATLALEDLQINSNVIHPQLRANIVQSAILIVRVLFVHRVFSVLGVQQISLLAVQLQDIFVQRVHPIVMGSLAPMGTIVLVDQQTRLLVRLLLANTVQQAHQCSQG